MKKVALPVIRPWVVKQVETILGFDDEVVVEYVTQQLEDASKPVCESLSSLELPPTQSNVLTYSLTQKTCRSR